MRAVSGNDPKQLVRRGYDALSYRYRADDAEDGNYGPWLAVLRARIPDGAAVLDLGCGNGIPVARHLAAAGHSVTGVDSSQVQIRRARRLVPAASFLRADITKLTLPAAAFDAVVCLYTLIADAATYRAWLQAAGLRITAEQFVPEGDGGHALFWAHRP
jgi:ubiquinone/menaquinone biosynthesis C-methylase UbiE